MSLKKKRFSEQVLHLKKRFPSLVLH